MHDTPRLQTLILLSIFCVLTAFLLGWHTAPLFPPVI